MKKNTCLFVLGMHRSGTSALTGSLAILGASIDSKLVAAVPSDNPKGYWEPVEVVNINDDIFSSFGMHYMTYEAFPAGWKDHESLRGIKSRIDAWYEKAFADSSLVVLKDPRFCRTLPLWVDVLESRGAQAKCINIFREPMEVVSSLQVRDAHFSTVDGLLAWLAHVVDSFACSNPDNTVILSSDTFLKDPISTLEKIGQRIGLRWPNPPKDAADRLSAFLDSSLVHHRLGGKIPYPPLGSEVERIADCLRKFDLKSPNAIFYACLDKGKDRLDELRALFECAIKNPLASLSAEKRSAIARAEELLGAYQQTEQARVSALEALKRVEQERDAVAQQAKDNLQAYQDTEQARLAIAAQADENLKAYQQTEQARVSALEALKRVEQERDAVAQQAKDNLQAYQDTEQARLAIAAEADENLRAYQETEQARVSALEALKRVEQERDAVAQQAKDNLQAYQDTEQARLAIAAQADENLKAYQQTEQARVSALEALKRVEQERDAVLLQAQEYLRAYQETEQARIAALDAIKKVEQERDSVAAQAQKYLEAYQESERKRVNAFCYRVYRLVTLKWLKK